MPINRAPLSSLFLLLASLTSNPSYAMLRPTALHRLQKITTPHVRHKVGCGVGMQQQQAYNRKLCMLAGIATTGGAAIYGGAYFLLKEKPNKEKTELATLHLSNRDRLKSFIKTILDSGMNLDDFKDKDNRTPLIAACGFGDLDSVKMIIDHDKVSIGSRELFAAIYGDRIEVVKFLLSHPNLKLETDGNGIPYSCNSWGWIPKSCDSWWCREGGVSADLYEAYRNQKIAEYSQKKLDIFISKQSK